MRNPLMPIRPTMDETSIAMPHVAELSGFLQIEYPPAIETAPAPTEMAAIIPTIAHMNEDPDIIIPQPGHPIIELPVIQPGNPPWVQTPNIEGTTSPPATINAPAMIANIEEGGLLVLVSFNTCQ